MRQQAKLSGMGLVGGGSSKEPSADSPKGIDATTDDGIMEMQARGLPIKFITAN